MLNIIYVCNILQFFDIQRYMKMYDVNNRKPREIKYEKMQFKSNLLANVG